MRKSCFRIAGLFLSGLPVELMSRTNVNTEILLAQMGSGWAATFGVGGELSFGNSRVTDLSADTSFGYARGNMTYRLAGSWGSFAEREVYSAEPAEQLRRSSVTVASKRQFLEGLTWRNAVYVQSAMSDFSDIRSLFESAANVALTEKVPFKFNLIYRRDCQTQGGLEPVDMGTAFGLRWQVE